MIELDLLDSKSGKEYPCVGTDWENIFYREKNRKNMFENLESFGRQLLIAIYLIICTIIAAKISFGNETRRIKEFSVIGILVLAIGIQYYYLIDVVTFVPATRFYTYDVSDIR